MKYKISHFERLTGVPSTTLRYYDSEGLLYPQRDDRNNYRSYSTEDILRLVQLRQFNAFGVPLSCLPARDRETSCAQLLASLEDKRREIEGNIEELYQLLNRIKLHENAYRIACRGSDTVKEARMVGTYRLFLSDPMVMGHENTPDIVRRWLACAPHVYSVLRVRYRDAVRGEGESCRADVGIGLMKNAFDSMGDTFQEPMQYSPINSCLNMMIETPDPFHIERALLQPMLRYIEERNLIPLDDFYGWIVYAPVGERRPLYRVSMRIAVG